MQTNTDLSTLTQTLLQADNLPKNAKIEEGYKSFRADIEKATTAFIGTIQQSIAPDEAAIRGMLTGKDGLKQLEQVMQALMPDDRPAPTPASEPAPKAETAAPTPQNTQEAAAAAIASAAPTPAKPALNDAAPMGATSAASDSAKPTVQPSLQPSSPAKPALMTPSLEAASPAPSLTSPPPSGQWDYGQPAAQ